MKKLLCLILVLITSLVCFTGCKDNSYKNIDTDKIKVGIIETRALMEKSRILFLDDELNEIGSLPLDYASVGESFEKPLVIDNTLYVIPQGISTRKDARTALEINLNDLDIKKHSIDQIAMYGIAADNENIYTANNLNGINHISKCNKTSGKVETLDFDSDYIPYLFCSNNMLYAFCQQETDTGHNGSHIYVYDNNLNLVKKIDTTECGSGQYRAMEHNGNIYFSNTANAKVDGPGNTVGVLNTTDYSLEVIKLNQNDPLDVQIYNNKLYITHCDIVQGLGGGLTVYDLETKEQTYTDFNHGAEQMSIANDKMYVLSDRTLYVYDMNTIELVNSTDISPMDNNYSYLSGLFVLVK